MTEEVAVQKPRVLEQKNITGVAAVAISSDICNLPFWEFYFFNLC